MVATASFPYLSHGPEPYPSEAIITHYANKARNGAGLIVARGAGLPPKKPDDLLREREIHPNSFNPDHGWHIGTGRSHTFDLTVGGCQNYLSMMTEAIHLYDSKCVMHLNVGMPGYDVSEGIPFLNVVGAGFPFGSGKALSEELMQKILDESELQSVLMKEVGIDGIYLHMSYRMNLLGRFLSPLTNKRTDKYGGSCENRARFIIELVDRVKKRCGKDFLVMVSISGDEPEGGFTLEDAVTYSRLFAGHIDLLQMKSGDIETIHCTGFIPERTPFLYMAEAVKKGGADIAVIANGGFEDFNDCEEAIASGKTDLIGMARAWICNTEYGKLAYEGRNEDRVPCLRCNGCHVSSYFKPWSSFCAVNPTWGMEHRVEKMITPFDQKMKIAVVGGGPAGMEAALISSRRGNEVTLYEKNSELGGLLKTIEKVAFKWPHRDFKNYLVRQIAKSTVVVKSGTEATPEMVKAGNYDAVIVAVGAEPLIPQFPGVDNKNVMFATNVFGHEDALKKNVVIIGGGEIGVETGIHLAGKGHIITVLEMTDMLARDSVPIHYYSMFKDEWEKLENFNYVLNAKCNGIFEGKVTFVDKDNKEHSIVADSVIIAAGMKPKQDFALKFYGTADRFYLIGDCRATGDIQKAMRSAFGIASNI